MLYLFIGYLQNVQTWQDPKVLNIFVYGLSRNKRKEHIHTYDIKKTQVFLLGSTVGGSCDHAGHSIDKSSSWELGAWQTNVIKYGRTYFTSRNDMCSIFSIIICKRPYSES